MNALIRSAGKAERALPRRLAAPAYRGLAQSRIAQTLPAQTLAGAQTLLGAIQTPLRSQFLPSEISVLGSRLLHTSQRLQEKSTNEAEAKTKEAKATEAKAPNEEVKEEAKEEAKEKAKEDGQGKEEGKDGEKDKSKEGDANAPPPPHGDKTPWQVFMETMNTEFQASKEWNESTKQIGAAAHQFNESEAVRRAREAYEKSTGAVSSTAASAIKSTAGAIGKGASWTWETPVMKGVRKAANVTGDAMDKATKPIRDTEAYKNVKDVIDDGSSSRYGGWVEKEERRRRRELRAKSQPQQVLQEDPEAGTNVTLHKDAAWKEAWRDFRDQNKVVQGIFSMKGKYEESENPLVSTARSITDRIGGWFAENETAMVVKKFREMDPSFQNEAFLQELREYILPEVLDAYVKGDTETLKLWLSAAQYSVYEALTKQYLQAGMKSDGRILDIRNVDILRARMLDPGEVPVFIITCRTQEVHVYRNAKTNELAAGMEDKVQLVTYAIGVTRVPEDVNNPETRGWRLIEMQKSGRDWY
ncbi:Mitochondrial inner membrane translocase complex, subunit Tim44 [Akanthomyces lecanii RCEF 1005]|uniref:Mitochondrial import inner membrane translocase subunit TIM44 n=1 Tax=Akanthomyces lecanii RCEF 1005 TaxID=1081108 RepID=A0A168DN27_CORDF|nr:Mitochondrial inner membrane translocase complex, subunit Tim44 [Akanthomyces lecanii RCEF 1005]